MTEASALAELLRPAIKSERVLAAIASVPRDRFVPAGERDRAYENVALPIGYGQTISQPLVVARMLELLELRDSDRVLDVGTGSGYHAALLALLAGEIWTIERHADLSTEAELAIRGSESRTSDSRSATGRAACPTTRRSMPSTSPPRPAPASPRHCRISSPRVAGWSPRWASTGNV